jgi:PKD repeat protein
LLAVIIAGSLFAAYDMEIGPFEEDDDDKDDGGNNGPQVDNNPIAMIEVNTTRPDVNDPLLFDGNESYGKESRNITEYRWDFDDGASESNMTIEHEFIASGIYNVSLTVTDELGNYNTSFIHIKVTQREDHSGNIQTGSDSLDFIMDEMPSKIFVNTTLQQSVADPDSNDITLRLFTNGTEVWAESLQSGWTEETVIPYMSDTNLTAGTWTWEITIDDAGFTGDIDWDVEIVIFYG